MAAFRNGIKTVLIPADNAKDLEEIDQTVRKALQFVLVERADQVLAQALNRPVEVSAPRRRGRKREPLPDLPPAPKGEEPPAPVEEILRKAKEAGVPVDIQ